MADRRTALDGFTAAARTRGGAVALEHIGQPPRTLTYTELWHECVCAAAGIVSLGRAARGAAVATLCDEAPQSVVALVGISMGGYVIVPLDPASPSARLRFLIEDCNAEICVCTAQQQLSTQLPGDASLLELEAAISAGSLSPLATSAAAIDTPCHLIYTSGSTGLPKAVVVTHRSVAAYCSAKQTAHGVQHTSRVLLASAHTWDPFLGDVFSTLAAGAALVSAPRAAVVHDLAHTLIAGGVTHVLATPSLWSLLAAVPHELPRLECVALGGEPLPHSLAAPWLSSVSLTFANTYGVTEATVYNTFGKIQSGAQAHAEYGRLSVGWPLDGVRVGLAYQLADEAAEEAGEGGEAVGEILIGGDQVGLGYHKQPDLSAARFVTGLAPHEQLLELRRPFDHAVDTSCRWFCTGDLGTWRPDGLHVLGRRDAQVKLRGHRIELGEVEAAARLCGVVAAAAAAVVSDTLLLYVVPVRAVLIEAFLAAGGEAAVRVALRKTLPQHMQPARILPIAALPLTPGGKLLRADLPPPPQRPPPPATPEIAKAADTRCGGPSALRGHTEHAVASAWSGVLGVGAVGPHDNFFELGGTSIHAVRMLRLLQGPLRDLQGIAGDAFERGNQRFATRLCGLYRKPRLRDFCVWLEWAALAPPVAPGVGDDSSEPTGLVEADPTALLAAGDAALPELADIAAIATDALGAAAAARCLPMVSELLHARAAVNGGVTRSDPGMTPLMRAAAAQPDRSLRCLAPTCTADAPLTGTMDSGEVITMLLAAGASANLASLTQQTALHLAAASGDASAVDTLLCAGAVPHARDMNKWSALFHAARGGSDDCVRRLIRSRCDAHARDRWGFTPLSWSAAWGHAGAAAALLEAGALVDGGRRPQAAHLQRHNQLDNSSEWRTPLHLAVRYASAETAAASSCATYVTGGGVAVLRVLLACRADPTRCDQRGRTALQCANDLGCAVAIEHIQEALDELPSRPQHRVAHGSPPTPLRDASGPRQAVDPSSGSGYFSAAEELWAWPPLSAPIEPALMRGTRWTWPPRVPDSFRV